MVEMTNGLATPISVKKTTISGMEREHIILMIAQSYQEHGKMENFQVLEWK
jgi:hypothetical protein